MNTANRFVFLTGGSEMGDTKGEGWGQNSKHDKHNLQKSLMGPSGRQKKGNNYKTNKKEG